MLPTPLSALIGVLFVLLAVGAVWLMFDGSRMRLNPIAHGE